MSPFGASGAGVNPHVPLTQWSDVVFLDWQQRCGGSLGNLKHAFRHEIANRVTNGIIDQIVGEELASDKSKLYPLGTNGIKYEKGDREFNALLGTPNGAGVGFLLAQHKTQIGVKTVESITVFGEETELGYSYAMYLAIEDVVPT